MVDVRAAGPDAWKDVAAVMGERGDPARCFCQYFRLRGQQWAAGTRESNRRDLRTQVCDGDLPPGVSSADLYRGPLSVFLDAGFTEVSRTNARWVLVRKRLRPARAG